LQRGAPAVAARRADGEAAVTEAEWLVSVDLRSMLKFVAGRASSRKMRLYVCACVRRLWPLLTDARSRSAVETAERYADGRASRTELATASRQAWAAAEAAEERSGRAGSVPSQAAEALAWAAVQATFAQVTEPHVWEAAEEAKVAEAAMLGLPAGSLRQRRSQCALFRDLLGNPFRPATAEPEWLQGQGRRVVKLAQAIYDQRRFDAMSLLSAALQDAGCDNQDLLSHCRPQERHARGCWLLDALLGLGDSTPPDAPPIRSRALSPNRP
jgi:hypothetical protein